MSILLLIIIVPLLFSAANALLKGKFFRTSIMGCAAIHLAAAIAAVNISHADSKWLGVQSEIDGFFLLITSLLYFAVSLYSCFWIKADHADNSSITVFGICMPAFISSMSLVILAQNLGLMWVAVEATTLVSAPLILFHRSGRALEAMWKYLLICSVGIGLALLGTLLLALSARYGGVELHDLSISGFMAARESLSPLWFKAAFIMVLAGYGTKMGLAPFHTWLPDAHSEAPGAVSALLSAGLLNCSFLGIVRVAEMAPQAAAAFCNEMFIALGVLSLATAAFFIIHQSDFKRMLAYSSIEHMGLAAIICGVCGFNWSALHLGGHSAIKMALFLLAGNILLGCGTRQISKVSGLFSVMPRNAILFFAGVILICGVPPSPLFFTELQLLMQAPLWLSITVAILLFMVFAGMFKSTLGMIMGKGAPQTPSQLAAEKLSWVPIAGLLGALWFSAAVILTFSNVYGG